MSQNNTSPATAPVTSSNTTPPLEVGWTRVQRKRPRPSEPDDELVACDCSDSANCGRQPAELYDAQQKQQLTKFKGEAIFLLHDMDSKWFQGYFKPEIRGKPWGMLAVQQELDDCLQCEEGGFRQIQLTVQKDRDLGVADWTGGDMMRLQGKYVSMQPTKLLTGSKAAALATTVFQGLLKEIKVRANDEKATVLELLPDVAVVYGTMELVLPPKEGGGAD
jgi:hypothetical protein